jgi:SRSO17 transposase
MADGASKGYFGGMSMTGDQIRSLQPALAAHLERFRHCFKRVESFRHWQQYISGLIMLLKRKSIEPIALAIGVPVRTLQEFLAFFAWDHELVDQTLRVMVAEEHASDVAIGVVDASAHAKSGDKTPGVKRQWCGETGKIDNCVVGQHLLYTNNDPRNPFSCVLASDLFVPEEWSEDRERCREAGIPDDVAHRPKWRIAVDQIETAIRDGIQFRWITFDEDYGHIRPFWFELDRLGQQAVGEVSVDFRCWPRRPWYRSHNRAHASKRVDNVCRHSPIFTKKRWKRIKVKDVTRGEALWDVKAARVHLIDTSDKKHPRPTTRKYWLIVARNVLTGEIKYFFSNAPARTPLEAILHVAFARWHVEKWFERAKQETGFGDFEMRTYTSLIRHWLCARMAMFFLTSETVRLRGEKSGDHVRAGGEGRARPGHAGVVSIRTSEESQLAVRVLPAPQQSLLRESTSDLCPAQEASA